ncbi:hypothetical protein [Streptomyces sp. NPDC052042]|uniref:hypothetical protein n=1 Tax=Streptomyces sp. NPDC052042 TaxID=3365683 RepID=UPI0037CFFA33
MSSTDDIREWAGTTEDMHELHRFDSDRQARCNPEIRTYSRMTDRVEFREPCMTLGTQSQIEGNSWYMYRFCTDCAHATEEPPR